MQHDSYSNIENPQGSLCKYTRGTLSASFEVTKQYTVKYEEWHGLNLKASYNNIMIFTSINYDNIRRGDDFAVSGQKLIFVLLWSITNPVVWIMSRKVV